MRDYFVTQLYSEPESCTLSQLASHQIRASCIVNSPYLGLWAILAFHICTAHRQTLTIPWDTWFPGWNVYWQAPKQLFGKVDIVLGPIFLTRPHSTHCDVISDPKLLCSPYIVNTIRGSSQQDPYYSTFLVIAIHSVAAPPPPHSNYQIQIRWIQQLYELSEEVGGMKSERSFSLQ